MNNPLSYVDPTGRITYRQWFFMANGAGWDPSILYRSHGLTDADENWAGAGMTGFITAADVWASWYRSTGDWWAADGRYHSIRSIMEHRFAAEENAAIRYWWWLAERQKHEAHSDLLAGPGSGWARRHFGGKKARSGSARGLNFCLIRLRPEMPGTVG